MINIIRKKMGLILLTIIVFIAMPLSAQLKYAGLIFSEVYLNENEPDKSWIEIYNPTSVILVLENFRFNTVLSPNILPKEIKVKGGIEISPGKCIVLCADKSRLNFDVSSEINLIEIKGIKFFGKVGGFFSLRTKGLEEDGEDIFRYGDPVKTSKLENLLGDFVVPFATNTESYTRIKNQIPGKRLQPNFIKTEPSLGDCIEIGGKNE